MVLFKIYLDPFMFSMVPKNPMNHESFTVVFNVILNLYYPSRWSNWYLSDLFRIETYNLTNVVDFVIDLDNDFQYLII